MPPDDRRDDETTLGMARFEGRVEAKLDELMRTVQMLVASLANYVTRREVETIEARIRSLEAHNTWINRTIGGAIILAVIGLLFAARTGHL